MDKETIVNKFNNLIVDATHNQEYTPQQAMQKMADFTKGTGYQSYLENALDDEGICDSHEMLETLRDNIDEKVGTEDEDGIELDGKEINYIHDHDDKFVHSDMDTDVFSISYFDVISVASTAIQAIIPTTEKE